MRALPSVPSATVRRAALLTLVAIVASTACSGDDDASHTTEPPLVSEALDTPPVDSSLPDDAGPGPAIGDQGGSATVTIQDVTYEAEADLCVNVAEDIFFDGPAEGSDGSVAWVTVNRRVSLRSDAELLLDEAELDARFPDGAEEVVDVDVTVQVGGQSRFQNVPTQPLWVAGSATGRSGPTEVQHTFDGVSIIGVGSAYDIHFVGAEPDEPVAFEFEAMCN